MFKRLRQRINSFNTPFIPTATEFMQIDVDRVAKEIGLVEHGTERGKRGLPQSDATDFDEHENNIINRILATRGDAKSEYDLAQSTYNERLKGLNLSARSSEIRTEAESAISDFDISHHSGADTLHQLRRGVIAAEQELEEFRKERGIRSRAHYPEAKIYHIGVIAILFVVEAILNGSVFGKGHELGLIGGALYAMLIAFLNVFVLGLLGGLCFRLLYQPEAVWKVLGAVAIPLYFAGVGVLSLLGAHIRNAMNSGVDDYATKALETFKEDMLNVGDATSLIFIVMTAAFSLIAAVDFLRMDEPIFGYGRRDRKLRHAEDDYRHTKVGLTDEMQDIREDRVGFMKDELEQLRQHLSTHQTIVENRAQQYSRFTDYLAYLESTANTLLSRYRDANRTARDTKEPKHFGKAWKMPEMPLVQYGDPNQDISEVRAKVEETTHILEESISKLEQKYLEHVHRYNRIEELSREEVKNAQATIAEA